MLNQGISLFSLLFQPSKYLYQRLSHTHTHTCIFTVITITYMKLQLRQCGVRTRLIFSLIALLAHRWGFDMDSSAQSCIYILWGRGGLYSVFNFLLCFVLYFTFKKQDFISINMLLKCSTWRSLCIHWVVAVGWNGSSGKAAGRGTVFHSHFHLSEHACVWNIQILFFLFTGKCNANFCMLHFRHVQL